MEQYKNLHKLFKTQHFIINNQNLIKKNSFYYFYG